MVVDSCRKFTLEDILKDFPEKKKTIKFIKKKFSIGPALAFMHATYDKTDDSRSRTGVLTYGDIAYTCQGKNTYSPVCCVHIDSYKKEDGVWRIQILKTLSIVHPEDGKAYIRMDYTQSFLQEIYKVNYGEFGNYANITHEGIMYTFELNPEEVSAFIIPEVKPQKIEELPF